jgi:large subunit ribosomal protein L15
MPHSKRKIRKQRGSRTHGWGQVGQHRAGGSRGGKGATGRSKHKWTKTVKYEPKYFGKHGFQSIRNEVKRAINVGEVNEMMDKLLEEKMAVQDEDKIIVDLHALGYEKLLGNGKITKAFSAKVNAYSKRAAEKIEKVGGKILTPYEK